MAKVSFWATKSVPKRVKVAYRTHGHAGGKALSTHKKFNVAEKQCKKLRKQGKDVAVYLHKHPYGWGFVSSCGE